MQTAANGLGMTLAAIVLGVIHDTQLARQVKPTLTCRTMVNNWLNRELTWGTKRAKGLVIPITK